MHFHLSKILTILSIVIYPFYAYSHDSVKERIKDNYNNITGASVTMRSQTDTLKVMEIITGNNGRWLIGL